MIDAILVGGARHMELVEIEAEVESIDDYPRAEVLDGFFLPDRLMPFAAPSVQIRGVTARLSRNDIDFAADPGMLTESVVASLVEQEAADKAVYPTIHPRTVMTTMNRLSTGEVEFARTWLVDPTIYPPVVEEGETPPEIEPSSDLPLDAPPEDTL